MALKIGESASFQKTITETDIYNYAGISGDFNSAHVNKEEAGKGPFGGCIAHGMLAAGFISAVLGTKLPGAGTIYLSQSLGFKAPVRAGDTITAIVSVKEILNEEKGIYKMETVCLNQYGVTVIDGEAVVQYRENCISGKKVSKENTRTEKYTSFYSSRELRNLGIKRYGENVLISRNAVIYSPEMLEVGNNVRIDDFTTISGKVVLGNYIHIAQACGLYGGDKGIYMDDFAGLSSRVVIYTVSNDYSGNSLTNPMVPAKYRPGDKSIPVHLGKHAIIGTSSVILPGADIGEGSAVGAMSMVGKPLGTWGIYAGSPAKKIKDRNKKLLELENDLKTEFPGGGEQKSNK